MGDRWRRDQGGGRPQHDRNERYDRDYDPYDRYYGYDRNDRYERHARSRSRSRSPSPRYRDARRNRSYAHENAGNGYNFRGAAAPSGPYTNGRPQDNFTFRAPGPPAPHFPPEERNPRQPQPQRRRPLHDQSQRERVGQPTHVSQAGRGRGRGGRRGRPQHARDILHKTRRGSTPDQLEGMNLDHQTRFVNIISSDEESSDVNSVIDLTADSDDFEEGEVPRKRLKTEAEPAHEQAVPKWSNPDPYTSLPPPETLGAPKKDIVQVIRKAKVDSGPKSDLNNAVKENADFISFNFDDDIDDPPESDDSMLVNAPSAPANMARRDGTEASHMQNGPNVRLGKHTTSFQPINGHARDPVVNDGVGPPPPPPNDFLMPTDDELVHMLATGSKGKKRKREQQAQDTGDVLPEWEPDDSDPVPWCSVDYSRSTDPGIPSLHSEICDFFDFVRPHDYEEAIRRDLIDRIGKAVQRFGGGGKTVTVECFGSFAAGLYLPTADMDLVAVSEVFLRKGQRSFCQSGSQMYKLGRHLENVGIAASGTGSAVTKAKVPIIKFVDKRTGIKVDVSFENDTGLVANQTFRQWKVQYPDMPIIVVLIKQLLAMRGLNEVFTGGLGGFSIICLVVSMLQHLSEAESAAMEPEQRYAKLLLRFLNLYGNEFDIKKTGIIMNPGNRYNKITNPKKKQNAKTLTIIDPNNAANDISGGSREIVKVLAVFRTAYFQLQRRIEQIESGKDVADSILGCMWGGNYTSFIHQRDKLSRLHRGYGVSPPPAMSVKRAPQLGEPEPQRQKPHGTIYKADRPNKKGYVDLYIDPNPNIWQTPVPTKPERKAENRRIRNEKAVLRASEFKICFPHVPNIPSTLNGPSTIRLIKDHRLDHDTWKQFWQASMKSAGYDCPSPQKAGHATKREIREKKEVPRKDMAKQRSSDFKAQFPHVPDVPKELNGRALHRLIEHHQLETKPLTGKVGKRA